MFVHLLYIDPGSSSMIIQLLIAGALGFVFFIKNGWYKLKSFFTRQKEKPEEDDQPGA